MSKCLSFALVILSGLPALAQAPAVSPPQRGEATLYVSQAAGCEENYAGELRALGINVRTSAMGSLRSMSRLLGLPNGVEAKHLLLIEGYVVADHVAPAIVAELVNRREMVSGVIGPAGCPSTSNHAELHNATSQLF